MTELEPINRRGRQDALLDAEDPVVNNEEIGLDVNDARRNISISREKSHETAVLAPSRLTSNSAAVQ